MHRHLQNVAESVGFIGRFQYPFSCYFRGENRWAEAEKEEEMIAIEIMASDGKSD